jgi:hypothetical protein
VSFHFDESRKPKRNRGHEQVPGVYIGTANLRYRSLSAHHSIKPASSLKRLQAIADEVLAVSTRVAFVSTPSIFFSLPEGPVKTCSKVLDVRLTNHVAFPPSNRCCSTTESGTHIPGSCSTTSTARSTSTPPSSMCVPHAAPMLSRLDAALSNHPHLLTRNLQAFDMVVSSSSLLLWRACRARH